MPAEVAPSVVTAPAVSTAEEEKTGNDSDCEDSDCEDDIYSRRSFAYFGRVFWQELRKGDSRFDCTCCIEGATDIPPRILSPAKTPSQEDEGNSLGTTPTFSKQAPQGQKRLVSQKEFWQPTQLWATSRGLGLGEIMCRHDMSLQNVSKMKINTTRVMWCATMTGPATGWFEIKEITGMKAADVTQQTQWNKCRSHIVHARKTNLDCGAKLMAKFAKILSGDDTVLPFIIRGMVALASLWGQHCCCHCPWSQQWSLWYHSQRHFAAISPYSEQETKTLSRFGHCVTADARKCTATSENVLPLASLATSHHKHTGHFTALVFSTASMDKFSVSFCGVWVGLEKRLHSVCRWALQLHTEELEFCESWFETVFNKNKIVLVTWCARASFLIK
jgi:hypothetical protein